MFTSSPSKGDAAETKKRGNWSKRKEIRIRPSEILLSPRNQRTDSQQCKEGLSMGNLYSSSCANVPHMILMFITPS
jgi:hypothetical protein